VLESAASMPGVVVSKPFGLLCSAQGKQFLIDEITSNELTHLVVGGCSPRQHESTFMDVCEQSGLNPYLFQMVNLREHCSWIIEDHEAATEKAIRAVRSAIARVNHHEALRKKEIELCTDVLIVGGGIAGMEAALTLADGQRTIYLVEKDAFLGGSVRKIESIFGYDQSGTALIESRVNSLESTSDIRTYKGSQVTEILGFLGNYIATINICDENREEVVEVGAVILATGFFPQHSPDTGENSRSRVFTTFEIAEMISPAGPTKGKITWNDGESPKSLAIMHCIGRSEAGYCSGVCCRANIQLSLSLREHMPDLSITHFHSGLCLPGQSAEDMHRNALESGIEFIYAEEPDIDTSKNQISIQWTDETGKAVQKNFDVIAQSPAMVPARNSGAFAESLNVDIDDSGFIQEAHEKLEPTATSVEGIFTAGCAQGPMTIGESIMQARAAAGRILSVLVPGRKLEPELRVANIVEELCIGCQQCMTVCAYGAISYNELKTVCEVNEVLCRGCGNCTAACPSGANRQRHFKSIQIYPELCEALR